MPSSSLANVQIVLADSRHFPDAWLLLTEYYEAVQVIVRDQQESLFQDILSGHSFFWIAHSNQAPAGCILLRPLASPSTSEIKHLYVRPQYREQGLAHRLLSALESHAAALKIRELYLDTKDDLTAAIHFYRKAGYTACDRYNDNPQASLFLTKTIS